MTTSSAAASSLVPLRVDVSDGPVRIVDTILFDPTCWPLPLHSAHDNAQEIAYNLISDMEVHGMGRTARHFTGRLDLWTQSLQTKVARQIQSQIEQCREQTLRKKRRVEKATTEEKSSGEDTVTPPVSPSSVIKIKLRLMVNGVAIKDDFDWDPSVPVSPIAFATQLASDLKLPEDSAVAIATSIVEQLNGTVSVKDEQGLMESMPVSSRSVPTVAWTIDTRDQVANISSVVAQHRPTAGNPR